MKRITALMAGMMLCLSLMTGCGSNPDESVKITVLKGPTAMGMVKLMEDSKEQSTDGSKYEFSIAGSIDEITPNLLVQGKIDIAAVPANMAAVFYNNADAGIQVLAIHTLGSFYIAETGDEIHSVSDLKGRTIYSSGKGAVPEYALRHVLSANGIDPDKDVTIEWKSEHSECVAALAASGTGSDIALLPQPFAANAQMKNDGIRLALDLTKEWEKIQEEAVAQGGSGSALITGVLVARTEFVKENKEAVSAFMDSYKNSVEYVNNNIQEAALLIGDYDIVPAEVAEKALPYCNITFIEGSEMRDKLSGYLKVLMEQNPKAVGGALPDEEFYYIR